MATPVRRSNHRTVEEPFIEKHFAKIAFAVSILVMTILSPLVLILGSAFGYALNHYLDPNLRLGSREKIVTILNATLAIVGATATVVSFLPAASMGSPIFHAIPFLSCLSIGSTIYRCHSSLTQY